MSESDQAIVEAVLAGDQHRFGELVDDYQGKIVNYVYKMLGNYEDAVDVSQEVFLKAYTALDTYKPKYPFAAWLFRIARNAAIDELRRRRGQKVSLDEPLDLGNGAVERQVPDSGPDPEAELLQDEFQGRVEAAVGELPEKYREPLVLRHAGGLTYDAIAEALELPLGTVKTRIHRAREALRESLGDVLEGDPGTSS